MYNILICDDQKDIVHALKIYLNSPDYTLFEAYDGKTALDICEKNDIHLLLLDIMMPIMDGISVLSRIRESSNLPVIFLTAKSEDSDKILGLDIGADDYITKPFNPAEVCARVRSALRRYMQLGSRDGTQTLIAGPIELDDGAKRVTLDGAAVALTPTEYDILQLLMTSPGIVFPPKKIYEKVWGGTSVGSENTVAVHIRHLREKLEIDPASPRHIKVVWGQGYKIEKGRSEKDKG